MIFDKKEIPKILKRQRIFEGMTQKEVAEIIGIPYQDYQKYEYGILIPKKERYKELCEAIGIPLTNEIYHLTKLQSHEERSMSRP